MKKLNPNAVVFVFAAVFILTGLFSKDLVVNTDSAVKGLATDVQSGEAGFFHQFTSTIDNDASPMVSYHDWLMDLSSVKENLLGTRVIAKSDTTVIKSMSGSLCDKRPKVPESDLQTITSQVSRLKDAAERSGAHFLYCAAPRKEYFETLPANVENHFAENYHALLEHLRQADIPCLDFTQTLSENASAGFPLYYRTDHHWTTRSGFAAAKNLCETLHNAYGFSYQPSYTDSANYEVKTYPHWLLGSKGKKVGAYFSWDGADDFELITPKFSTDLTEEQPLKNETRTGSFEDSVLFPDNLKKDYYHMSAYSTYCGGDFRLQIMKNNLNPNGEKVLIIRDSYACAVAPFLALQTSELHLCDMRNFRSLVGDKLNMEEHIKEYRPDYVLVLYAGIAPLADSQDKYNFF